MPSHSAKQHRFMEAIAHSPSFAKKAGVPQSVGKDFAAADKGKTFKKGGEMKESKSMIKKEVAFMKAKGAPKSMIKHEQAESKGYKSGGRIKRYDEGGISEGQNRNIDDDTRARAMAWAARGGRDEEAAPAARSAAARARPSVTRVTEVEATRPAESGRGFNRQPAAKQESNTEFRGFAGKAEGAKLVGEAVLSMLPLGRAYKAIRGGVGMLDRVMTRRAKTNEATPKLDEMMGRVAEREAQQGSRSGLLDDVRLKQAREISENPEAMRSRQMIEEVPVGTSRRNEILEEAKNRAITSGRGESNPFEGMKHSNEMSTAELMDRAQMIGGGYKRGGNVKETMGPMTMAEDVEGGMRGRQMRFGEHSEQRRGHTRGTNMGDSGPSVGIEGGGKMKAAHVKHIMTMAAGGLTAPQIAKIMSSMHKGAAPAGRAPMAPPMMPRQPMARPGMAPGMSHGGRTKRMAVGGISAQPSPQTNMPQGSTPGIQAQAPQPSTLPVNTATSNQQPPYHPNPNPNRANLNPAYGPVAGRTHPNPAPVDVHAMHQQNPDWHAGSAAWNAANSPLVVKSSGKGEMMRNDPTRTNRHPAMVGPKVDYPSFANSFKIPTGAGGGTNPNQMMGGNLNLARALMSGQKMAPQQTQTLPPPPQQTQTLPTMGNFQPTGSGSSNNPNSQVPETSGFDDRGWLPTPQPQVSPAFQPQTLPSLQQQTQPQIKPRDPQLDYPQITSAMQQMMEQARSGQFTPQVLQQKAVTPQVQTSPVDDNINPATGQPYGGWQTGIGSDGSEWAAAAGGVVKKLPTAKQMGAMGMKKGGRVKETMGPRTMKEDVERGSNRHLKHGESAVQKKGHTKGKNLGDSGKTVGIERGPKHFAKGGHVKSIDGIARRGHTKVKYR